MNEPTGATSLSFATIQLRLLKTCFASTPRHAVLSVVFGLLSTAVSTLTYLGLAKLVGSAATSLDGSATSTGNWADSTGILVAVSLGPAALAAALLVADGLFYLSQREAQRCGRLTHESLQRELVEKLDHSIYRPKSGVAEKNLVGICLNATYKASVSVVTTVKMLGVLPSVLLLFIIVLRLNLPVGLGLLILIPLGLVMFRRLQRVVGRTSTDYFGPESQASANALRQELQLVSRTPFGPSNHVDPATIDDRLDQLDRLRVSGGFLRFSGGVATLPIALALAIPLAISMTASSQTVTSLLMLAAVLLKLSGEGKTLASLSSSQIRLVTPVRTLLSTLSEFEDRSPPAADAQSVRPAVRIGDEEVVLRPDGGYLLLTDRPADRIQLAGFVDAVNRSCADESLQIGRCNVLGRGQDATPDQFTQTDVVFASQSLRKKFERISATGPIFVWVSEGAGTTPTDYDFVLREGPDGFDRAWIHGDVVSTLAPESQADETDACTFDDMDM